MSAAWESPLIEGEMMRCIYPKLKCFSGNSAVLKRFITAMLMNDSDYPPVPVRWIFYWI